MTLFEWVFVTGTFALVAVIFQNLCKEKHIQQECDDDTRYSCDECNKE
jgi:hypothetical protein